MRKMNKKGFTLVELLAVIVILAILMAIAATNIGPVIDNSRRSSMRTTAQQIIDAVRLQLTSNYELFPGTYAFDKGILDSGGISAPFGGEYAYYSGNAKKIGSGVYSIDAQTPDVHTACSSATYSYVVVSKVNDNYEWSICLTTKPGSGESGSTGGGNPPGGYLAALREELDNKDETSIFHGRASGVNQAS